MINARALLTNRFWCMLVISLLVSELRAGGETVATAEARQDDYGLEVGKMFPDLPLPALADGRSLSIADFRGKRIILHIFASW